jgi:hypothetical protein
MAISFQSQPDVIMSQANRKADVELGVLANDLNHIVNMGKRIMAIRQRKLGESVLPGKVYSNEGAQRGSI